MRGSIVFAVGVVMMAVALTAVVATAVMVNRQESEPLVAQEPVAAPANPAPPEPVVQSDPPEAAPEYERFDIPDPEPGEPRPAPPTRGDNEPPPRAPQSELEGAVPAADTSTYVAAKTCDGGTIKLNAAEKQMFDLHNKTRTQRGLGSLCVSPYLTKLSRSRSQDMLDRNYFSHYTPEGTSVTDMVERSGNPNDYVQVGENISKGGDGTDTDLPRYMFAGLMDSPGHRENILRKGFDEIGVGAVSGVYEPYDDVSATYTMVFGAVD